MDPKFYEAALQYVDSLEQKIVELRKHVHHVRDLGANEWRPIDKAEVLMQLVELDSMAMKLVGRGLWRYVQREPKKVAVDA